MRIPALLPTVFIASVTASSLLAQDPQRITRVGPGTIIGPGSTYFYSSGSEQRAIIGVSTTNSATSRDTLGVLVSSVRTGSPADKAGIEEGNRIASINGVSLRLAAADVGDEAMAGVLSRRLQRELDKLRPGDAVDLAVNANGQTKNLKVTTIAPPDLNEQWRRSASWDDRATLGINIGLTGSSRDSIGVFVMSVEDNGPAAKAGIEEGSRIASINGVDLRGRSRDQDDYYVRVSAVSRLERELSRAKPGDEVDLRVYANGQFKNVKVKTVSTADLPRRNRTVTVTGGDNFAFTPGMLRFDNNFGVDIGDHVRRALEEAKVGVARGMDGMRAFTRIGGGRIDW